MNEDQMIEAAAMLINECGNFRLQDYTLAFSMAKRGEVARIMDRLDISIINQMLDEYRNRRNMAAIKQEKTENSERIGTSSRTLAVTHLLDAKLSTSVNNFCHDFWIFKK